MEGVAFSVVAVGVNDDANLSATNNGNGRAEAGETVGLSVTLRAAGLCGVDDVAGRLGVSVGTGAGCVETYTFGHSERFRDSHSFGNVSATGTVTNARSDSFLVPLLADHAGAGECRGVQVGLTLLLEDGRHGWSVPLVLPVY